MKNMILAGCLSVTMLMPVAASAADLVVDVQGARDNSGTMRMTLFAKGDFMNYDQVLRRSISLIRSGEARFRIRGLEPGTYSFTILHDANANAEADRNFLGIPVEGVAISNNARGTFGPPDREDAEFSVSADGAEQVVELVYY